MLRKEKLMAYDPRMHTPEKPGTCSNPDCQAAVRKEYDGKLCWKCAVAAGQITPRAGSSRYRSGRRRSEGFTTPRRDDLAPEPEPEIITISSGASYLAVPASRVEPVNEVELALPDGKTLIIEGIHGARIVTHASGTLGDMIFEELCVETGCTEPRAIGDRCLVHMTDMAEVLIDLASAMPPMI
jgi:hypothetical protein